MSMYSRVSEHAFTKATIHLRCSSRRLAHINLRKWTPFGSSNNVRTVCPIPRDRKIERVPVNGGEVKGRKIAL